MRGEVTYGRALRTIPGSGVVFTETLHEPELALPAHEHTHAQVNFVFSGSFEESVGRRAFGCQAGSMLVKPAGAPHSNRYGSRPAHCLIVEFLPAFGAREWSDSRLLDDILYTEETSITGIGWRLRREIRAPDSATPLAVSELVQELLGAADSERARGIRERSAPSWLSRVRDQLDHASGDIDCTQLASALGVHPRHMMRAFRRYAGCSLGEYLRRRRVRRAQRLLTESDLTVAQVAVDTGFYDQSHFTRTFRRLSGLTPGAYRELMRL